jgi:P-type Cu+ transporter
MKMASPPKSCDLCGLPLRFGTFTSEISGKTYRFCCNGCKQVFHLLLESSDGSDPETFKETELFIKCREMGLIPASEEELADRASAAPATTQTVDDPAHSSSVEKKADDASLNLSLKVDGMWCPACSWAIEETLKKTPGILSISCNFSTDRVICEYDPIRTSPDRIAEVIQRLGYEPVVPEEETVSRENRKEFIRFSISAFLTMNVMMLSFSLYFGFFRAFTTDTIQKLSWPIFIMASAVVFYGGRNIYRKAFAGLGAAAFGMETLITIGAFSAYFYSTFNLLSGSIHLYFDTASMLITLVLLGKLLERRAKGSIQQSLENFFSLSPTKVRICTDDRPDGRFVSMAQLQKNDVFRVEAEEIVPADGTIVAGHGAVDESAITGEPVPVEKKPGGDVKSGTKVTQGAFNVRADKIGEDATLGQMIRIMERALGTRTPFEGKTDRILQWFVPSILALAIGTGAVCLMSGVSVENSFIRAVTVMVISCPCALGVAIPLARVAGISVAGKKGVLVRDFFSFEKAQEITAFVFDKTGTITRGDWRLIDVRSPEAVETNDILAIAASIEKSSDHFIAMEIKRRAQARGIAPVVVEKIRSFENGVAGWYGNAEIKIGSRAFLKEEIENSGRPEFGEEAGAERPGRSLVYMSMAGRLCAVFVFGDRLKTTAKDTVRRLLDKGFRLALVSGDGEAATGYVGTETGIADAVGGMMPQDKVSYIDGLQDDGETVAMVGDGINDAPALAVSDFGIAVYSGGHLGKEAADITLMRGEPLQILDFLDLGKRVNRKIGQNLVCAFLYNAISIPIAMSGLLSPLVAVCAMLMSSLSVIGNTLLLVRKDH